MQFFNIILQKISTKACPNHHRDEIKLQPRSTNRKPNLVNNDRKQKCSIRKTTARLDWDATDLNNDASEKRTTNQIEDRTRSAYCAV